MAHAVHARKKAPAAQRRRMLEAPIPPLVCSLALPTIVSMLVTSIYNMADTYFVSQINTSASGAVGIVFSILGIVNSRTGMKSTAKGTARPATTAKRPGPLKKRSNSD